MMRRVQPDEALHLMYPAATGGLPFSAAHNLEE